MIDLIQWRVSIGMWCGGMKFLKRESKLVNNMQNHPSVKNYHWESENFGVCIRTLLIHTSVCLYALTACIFLHLILSGDVESNPGPVG